MLAGSLLEMENVDNHTIVIVGADTVLKEEYLMGFILNGAGDRSRPVLGDLKPQ